MPITDQDLDLLESYLDDALAERDVESLRSRLGTDADLVAALNQIREQRTLRRALFAALEPDPSELDAFTTRVRRAIPPSRQPANWSRRLRLATAAAACVAAGFFARGLFDRPPSTVDPSTVNPVNHPTGVDLRKVDTYQVTLRDDSGKVLAVQQFDSLDKAQEFAADLARWQAGNERLASSHFVVTADRF